MHEFQPLRVEIVRLVVHDKVGDGAFLDDGHRLVSDFLLKFLDELELELSLFGSVHINCNLTADLG